MLLWSLKLHIITFSTVVCIQKTFDQSQYSINFLVVNRMLQLYKRNTLHLSEDGTVFESCGITIEELEALNTFFAVRCPQEIL